MEQAVTPKPDALPWYPPERQAPNHDPSVESLVHAVSEARRCENAGMSKSSIDKIRLPLHDAGFSREETRKWINEIYNPNGVANVRQQITLRRQQILSASKSN